MKTNRLTTGLISVSTSFTAGTVSCPLGTLHLYLTNLWYHFWTGCQFSPGTPACAPTLTPFLALVSAHSPPLSLPLFRPPPTGRKHQKLLIESFVLKCPTDWIFSLHFYLRQWRLAGLPYNAPSSTAGFTATRGLFYFVPLATQTRKFPAWHQSQSPANRHWRHSVWKWNQGIVL